MTSELGQNWRSKHFASFSERPFAAASIGQVHKAVFKDPDDGVEKQVLRLTIYPDQSPMWKPGSKQGTQF